MKEVDYVSTKEFLYISEIYRRKNVYEIRKYSNNENVDFVIIGVPFDTAASNRVGTYYNMVEGLMPILENDVTPIIIGGDHSIS